MEEPFFLWSKRPQVPWPRLWNPSLPRSHLADVAPKLVTAPSEEEFAGDTMPMGNSKGITPAEIANYKTHAHIGQAHPLLGGGKE